MADWFENFTSKRQGSFIDDATGTIKFGLKKVDEAIDYVVGNGQEFVENLNGPLGTIVNGTEINGKKVNGLAETATQLGEASYDVPYNAAKSLGAPEGVAVAAGVTGALLEPSPLGEAKAATVAGELLSKTTKVVNKAPKGPPAGLQPAFATLNVQNGTVFYDGQKVAQDNIFRLTLKDPANIPSGVKQGSAWSDEWAGQSREYFARRAAAKEKLQSLIDARKKKSRIRDAQADLYNDASTGWTRDPEGNPIAFGKSKFKEQSEVTPLTKSGNPQMKEQHHLFTKQESYQFIDRMSELGDDDDLLSMFLMAEDMDAAIGGRFSNMLNVEKKSHQIGHSSRIYDGRQIKADEMANLVSSAKSTDELMTMFREYIIENVHPSADEARALEIVGSRLHKMDKYKYLDELYDKMYRSPAVASR